VIVQDSLDRPGKWPDTPAGRHARCLTSGGVLRAERDDRIELGSFRCTGPPTVIDGDFGVDVTTTLLHTGSCAAIWFHWNRDAGQVLRVCQGGITVAESASTDRDEAIGAFAGARPIALRAKTRIHLAVRDHIATLWQDNRLAGTVTLPAGDPATGQALIGIVVEDGDAPPPYAVTFSDLDIRSL
jgi:hypothetical protein